jgi:acyl phosphate:glycerol-3-phosphate acyltransferase
VIPELFAITVAYLVGSIPFAFLLSRRRGIDLRQVGSQNVGASNVLRTSGVRIAVVAMALDAVKGALAVILAQRLSSAPVMPVAAGLASVIGHVYPVWLRFHGGKGVATAAGAFAILTPVALAAATGVFLVTVIATRYISVGSIGAAFTLAAVTAIGEAPAVVAVGAAVVAVIVLYRHRGNLARLRAGTERRVGQRLFKKVV